MSFANPAPAAGSRAILAASNDEIPGTDIQADGTAKLNLIPAAADATKKESKIRNISTVWTTPPLKADSKNGAEAKK